MKCDICLLILLHCGILFDALFRLKYLNREIPTLHDLNYNYDFEYFYFKTLSWVIRFSLLG